MRRKIILAAVAILLLSPAANAQGPQGRPFGLGLCLGEPAGVTAKYWFDRNHAMDAAVGWGYWPHKGLAIYADYLYNLYTLIPAGSVPFDLLFYIGIGGKVGFWEKHEGKGGVGVGVRVPFGLTMVFTSAPFDVFLEITPSVGLGGPGDVYFDLDGCIGGRFYF
jgi:hypothetical protein